MGGKKKQTIGYRYYFSLHIGIGRGPVNQIAEVRVGGLTAYGGAINLKDSGRLVYINKPELFGGDKKEGGIQGPMYCYNGAPDQVLQPRLTSAPPGSPGILAGIKKNSNTVTRSLPSIASSLGGDVPNFRGVVTLWYDGLVCSMNPYPKEWAFRVRRWDAGWWNDEPWYPAKARVLLQSEKGDYIFSMNGAHMLYEINTNPEWGRGMPPELIDENSFIEAANTLCEENVGLCIPWFRQESIREFIPKVIDHIAGVQYVDRETGKLTLRLIRGDYDPDDLPLFTPDTGLLSILDDDASSEESAYNEIVVRGFDPTSKEDIQVRVQNLAAIQSQGEIISSSIDRRGFATRALCGRAALAELRNQLPLRRMTVTLDRRGWRIAPGMVFRISDPKRGISSLVLRAGEVTDGSLAEGKITVKAVQDVFGMPVTEYITPTGGDWVPPNFTPAPSPESKMYELNWRDFYRATDTSEQNAVDAGASYVAILAKQPPGVQVQGFDVATSLLADEYTSGSSFPTVGFTGWLTLDGALGPLDTELTVADVNVTDFLSEYEDGMAVLIDDEQLEFVSFDEDTLTATLKRGVADTIPASHLTGRTIWLIDDEIGADKDEYQSGETVYGKALTRTSTEVLLPELATTLDIVVGQRVFAPYPPGDVKIDTISIYSHGFSPYPEPVFTWTHRDRKLQADTLIGHAEGSVGPEPGTTYVFRVYAEDGTTLLRTEDVGAVDTWTYDSTMQTTDGNPLRVWVELESERDGVASFFHYRFYVVLSGGWGYDWGRNWGGQ